MPFENNNFIYNAQQGFVFAYVPKVACSNWKCVLRYLEGHDDYLNTKMAHDKSINGLTYLMDEDDPWAILGDPGIKKITFVRNPFSRCLSAYLNKIEFNLPKLDSDFSVEQIFLFATSKVEEFRCHSLGNDKFPKVTLEVFLRWLDEGPKWLTQNEHWKSQSELTLADQVSYDFVGRFENLQEDASQAMKMMGCDIEFPSQKDINFAPTSASSRLQEYYDEASEALVTRLFAPDFNHFGYEARL